jgi:predicted kinase
LSGSIGRAPGAVHLRSDIERKRLYGVHEFDRLPREAYRQENTAWTYKRLRDLASTALDAGQSAVIDAVHLRPDERRAVKRVASRSKSHFTGLWLDAPVNLLIERVAKREMDASDATVGVVSEQAKQPAGAMEWKRLDASGPLEAIAARAQAAISGRSPVVLAGQQRCGSNTAAPSSLPARRSANAVFASSRG